jgi:hypothetical protein
MQNKRDDFEPIIATRPSRRPLREEPQPIWHIALALVGVVVLVGALAWWWMSRTPTESVSTNAGPGASTEIPAATEEVVQQVAPPARDPQPQETAQPRVAPSPTVSQPAAEPEPEANPTPPAAEVAASPSQPATAEGQPEAIANPELPASATLDTVSVRFVSPDQQVQLELHRLLDTSPPLLVKAGDVVPLAPGPYRVIATGAQLDKFEQEVTFDGEAPVVYMVELCAKREPERESVAGRVVEERACGTTPECESMFAVLGEYADELVRDRQFRTEQCGKWRAGAVPEGSWTLNINCGGATLATTCRIEIAEGACTFAGPRRTVRGTACPRGELR